MRIMINKISILFETIIYTPCSLDLKIKKSESVFVYLFKSIEKRTYIHTLLA